MSARFARQRTAREQSRVQEGGVICQEGGLRCQEAVHPRPRARAMSTGESNAGREKHALAAGRGRHSAGRDRLVECGEGRVAGPRGWSGARRGGVRGRGQRGAAVERHLALGVLALGRGSHLALDLGLDHLACRGAPSRRIRRARVRLIDFGITRL